MDERSVDMAELERDILKDRAEIRTVTIGRDPSGSGGIIETEEIRASNRPVGIGPAPRREIIETGRENVRADVTLYFLGTEDIRLTDRVSVVQGSETREFEMIGKTKVTDARLIGMAASETPPAD